MATEAPNFLERVYHLRTSDFDLHSHILPSSVLDLFQDVAGEHAAMIGIGREDLLPLQRCWMILKTQYRVLRQPALFSDVTVRTWPLESHRVDFGREYTVLDADGQPLLLGSSSWVILDISRRDAPQIVPARHIDFGLNEYRTERNFPDGFARLSPTFTPALPPVLHTACYTDLDSNGHVNNIKYADFILNAVPLPSDAEVEAFRIDYMKELRFGADMALTHAISEDGKTFLCRGESNGSVNFVARLTLK